MRTMSWARITHRLTAAVLALFVTAHLINHLVGLGGIAAHQAFMNAARLVYRSPLVEPLLLTAVLVQIATGIAQVRAGWGKRHGVWARLQTISGLYLAFFLANHTFWVLVARIGYGLDSNFYLAATFLTISPLPLLFAPYYVAGVLAVFVHIACAVHFRVAGPLGTNIERILIAAGAAIASTVVAIFMGAFYEIRLPAEYRALLDSML
jgi:succinate dehydrogenase/fumarate reductase cytochrome b subunit